MKSISTAVLLVLYVGMVVAQRKPIVRSASYNGETKAIDIDVEYVGGCAEHTFKLETSPCFESFPVQCNTDLIDTTNGDLCEKVVLKKISIDLQEAKLADDYHSEGSISIRGDQTSEAVVILPPYKP